MGIASINVGLCELDRILIVFVPETFFTGFGFLTEDFLAMSRHLPGDTQDDQEHQDGRNESGGERTSASPDADPFQGVDAPCRDGFSIRESNQVGG